MKINDNKNSNDDVRKFGYNKTHIGAWRYKCIRVLNREGKYVYPINKDGNYESLLGFKELPKYSKLKDTGRKWVYTKNYKPVMDRILLDIDFDDLKTAFEVTKNILQDLSDYREYINVYFSGSKGFHIEIITDELDIIDTTVELPKDSCSQYVEFLNYFEDKYEGVDLSLKDVGARIIRIHHTKHEKTENYKILVDVDATLEEIIAESKRDNDMVSPTESILSKDKALYLLNLYSKPIEDAKSKPVTSDKVDSSIYAMVFNELKTNIHDKIFLIGSCLKGYVDEFELESIYENLRQTTNIEESDNSEQSFIDAYENDSKPCNMGALYNHYREKKLDFTNFNKLSLYLKSKLQDKSYDEFNAKREKYEGDWKRMLDEELYDYVDNSENIFKGIINSLSALFGYGSRFMVVNGGAEVGKSEYINTIKKLMPNFKNLGSSTPASVRRQNEYAFDRKIVYLGDKGLKGTDDEEFKGLYEVFGCLITEKEFIRSLVIGDSVLDFNLKSDGLCVFYSQPYTNLRTFKAGDQYVTRSTYITVNPVGDGLKVFLQDDGEENSFYRTHKHYIEYIIQHPIKLNISDDIKEKIYKASCESLRTAKYLLGLFKAYCQYMQFEKPRLEDVESFLSVFKPQSEISDIEYLVYEKLYNNLKPLTDKELDKRTYDDGRICIDYYLKQTKNRDAKSFFTAKKIQIYFQSDFKNNKNLKDTIDQIPDILRNLYNAGNIKKMENQIDGQNVYYLPYNEEMERNKEKMKQHNEEMKQ